MTQKKKTYKVVNVCLIFFQGHQEFIYTFQELESPSASAAQVVHTMCCIIITRILLGEHHQLKHRGVGPPTWGDYDVYFVQCKFLSSFHRCILNNYWMRLSMISWIIKTEVCVICLSLRLQQITQTQGFDNSWYHAKTEFNNIIVLLYIFHIIHPQTQKWSVQPFCFWGEHSKGLSNQANVELDMINAIPAADIAFIMSSSQAIVNWLNALDQSDFS